MDAKAKAGQLRPGLEEQLRLQISVLRDDTVPDCEVILFPGYYCPDPDGQLIHISHFTCCVLIIVLKLKYLPRRAKIISHP